jgi:hypothetical protein
MSKLKTITISGPFDARHVSGGGIPGVTAPLVGTARATSSVEPDETPSHTFAANGNTELPKRSNTIAHTLSRPSLRLKTSISLLRGRSNSNSLDIHRSREKNALVTYANPQQDTPVQSLRKKPSVSNLWQRRLHSTPTQEPLAFSERPRDRKTLEPVKPSMSPLTHKGSVLHLKPQSTTNPYQYNPQQEPKLPPSLPPKEHQIVRPKRADSGTAIDFANMPKAERPIGFQEIQANPDFAERMTMYTKTREYWANANHGLGDWVESTGSRRPHM